MLHSRKPLFSMHGNRAKFVSRHLFKPLSSQKESSILLPRTSILGFLLVGMVRLRFKFNRLSLSRLHTSLSRSHTGLSRSRTSLSRLHYSLSRSLYSHKRLLYSLSRSHNSLSKSHSSLSRSHYSLSRSLISLFQIRAISDSSLVLRTH